MRHSYLSAGRKAPNLLPVITPFTGIAFPSQQRECLISRVEEKVRTCRWLSAAGFRKKEWDLWDICGKQAVEPGK